MWDHEILYADRSYKDEQIRKTNFVKKKSDVAGG
jgi:hypothetical protein